MGRYFQFVLPLKTLIISFCLITIHISGCGNTTALGNKDGETFSYNAEGKPLETQLLSVTTYNITVDPESPFLNSFRSALKALPIFSKKTSNTCSGEGTFSIYTDYSQKITGKLTCLGIIPIDLESTLAKEPVAKQKEDMSKYDYYGMIFRENNPVFVNRKIPAGSAYFYPPKPLMINPMANPSDLPTHIEENSYVIYSDKDGKQIQSSGTISIEMINPKSELPEDIGNDYNYKDIAHIDVKAHGFTGVPKAQFLLFDSRQMYISTDPMIILKMIITSSAADILSANAESSSKGVDGSFISKLVGDLTIIFSMKKFEPSLTSSN